MPDSGAEDGRTAPKYPRPCWSGTRSLRHHSRALFSLAGFSSIDHPVENRPVFRIPLAGRSQAPQLLNPASLCRQNVYDRSVASSKHGPYEGALHSGTDAPPEQRSVLVSSPPARWGQSQLHLPEHKNSARCVSARLTTQLAAAVELASLAATKSGTKIPCKDSSQ
jgi:hypothetical protein